MNQQPDNPNDPREDINAYMDGELDAEAGARVEQRLAADAGAREESRELQRTWDLLDQLPTTRAGEKFAATTVEMAAVAAAGDVAEGQAAAPAGRRLPWPVTTATITAGFLVGYLVVAGILPRPNDELLENLPVIAMRDRYEQAEDVEFLRGLADAGVFSEDDPAGTGPDSFGGDRPQAARPPDPALLTGTRQQRRERIEVLSPGEKGTLSRQKEQYERLTADEKDRLHRFHAELTADPDEEKLQTVLNRYAAWLGEQPLEIQAELRGLTPPERIKRIAAVKRRPKESLEPKETAEIKRDRPLRLAKDILQTSRWLNDQVRRHREILLEKLPPAARQRPAARMAVRRLLWQHWQQTDAGEPPVIDAESLDSLKVRLSHAARNRMERQERPADQFRVLIAWVIEQVERFQPAAPLASADVEKTAFRRWLVAENWARRFLSGGPGGSRGRGRPGGPPGGQRVDKKVLLRHFRKNFSQKQRQELKFGSQEELLDKLKADYSRRSPEDLRPERAPGAFDPGKRPKKKKFGPQIRPRPERRFEPLRQEPIRGPDGRPPPP